MLSQLLAGLGLALGSGSAVVWLVAGMLLGLYVGVVPGLSAAVILSIVLVFVYHLSLQATLVFFLAIHAAGFFSASLTAILLNTPAHPEAVPVAFDGYPMAARGEAARALGISATSTAIGALVGFAILVGIFQVVNQITLLFHPPEYVALILLALALVGTLGVKRLSKAVISMCLGFLIASIGTSAITGGSRFTFGSPYLMGGIPLAVISIGVFAIPQMIMVFGTGTNVARQDILGAELPEAAQVELGPRAYAQVLAGMRDALRHWRLLTQSAIIGTISGIVPGIGGFAANYLSYTAAQHLRRDRRRLFGSGIPEGVAAAEAANIPKEEGGLVTVFGLGLPHGTSSALFLVALTIKGLQPGIGFIGQHPEIVYESLWIIVLSGLLGTVFGLISAPVLVRATRVPGPLLLPFVIELCLIGIFIGYRSYFPIAEALAVAVVGFSLRRLGYSLASIVIGLVMGVVLEQNIYLTHVLFPGLSFATARPGADVIFLMAVVVLVLAGQRMRRSQRGATGRAYPLLELATSAGVAVVCGFMAVYAATRYDQSTATLPVIAATIAVGAALWQIPGDVAAARGATSARESRRSATEGGRPSESGLVRDRSWGRYGQYSRELAAFGWVGLAVLLSYLFGFHIGVPAFCLLYGVTAVGRTLGGRRKHLAFAVGSAALLFVAVTVLFQLLTVVETPLLASVVSGS